ncbi:MAG: hypothetical protein AAF304_09105 [Pseudomonadota bacterium]
MRSFIFTLIILLFSCLHAKTLDEAPPHSACPIIDEVIVDLNELVDELRETKAISVFKKIHLKKRIDHLLANTKSYHEGKSDFTLEQIREQYHLFMLKVTAMIQATDAKLHQMICDAWSEIWKDIEDPIKFKKLTSNA